MTNRVLQAPGTLTTFASNGIIMAGWVATCPACQRQLQAVTMRMCPNVLCGCGVRVLIVPEKPIYGVATDAQR